MELDKNICRSFDSHHQHYAKDEDGNLVYIDNVEDGKKYFCIKCNMEMIPKRGNKNEHHFAHKQENPDCNWETYLHSLAKIRIAEWLVNTPSISLILPSFCSMHDKCPLKDSTKDCKGNDKSFDLKNYYAVKGIEYKVGEFIPDILLMPKKSDNDPLFIEIYVTHPCSKEKISSGIRIIEFQINEERQIDDIIKGNTIVSIDSNTPSSSVVKMYNFQKQIADDGVKDKEVGRFTIHKSGKAYIDTISCSQITTHKKGLCNIIVDSQMLCAPGFYNWGYAIALKHGIQFKSCTICKYSVYNEFYNIRMCKLYKKYGLEPNCSNNDATKCNYFRQGSIDLDEECPVNALNVNFNDYIFVDNTRS